MHFVRTSSTSPRAAEERPQEAALHRVCRHLGRCAARICDVVSSTIPAADTAYPVQCYRGRHMITDGPVELELPWY